MGQKFTDGARSKLAASITASSTSLNLADGSRFPTVDAGSAAVSDANNWCKLVVQDAAGFEIVYARTHDAATTPNEFSNVLRGQDGTTARAFGTDADVGVRPTAGDMDRAVNAREPSIAKSLGYLKWTGAAWAWADEAYLLASHAASGVTGTKLSNWDTAFGWGNHANAGYLTSSAIGASVQAYSPNLTGWAGKAAPAGAIADLTSTQILSSKTLTNPVISNYAYFSSEFNAGNSGTAVTLNFANGQKQRLTLTGNATITLSFPGVGNYQVLCVQDGTGGRTPAGFSGVTARFLGSATMPAFNTAASGESIMSIYYNGSVAYIAVSKVGA